MQRPCQGIVWKNSMPSNASFYGLATAVHCSSGARCRCVFGLRPGFVELKLKQVGRGTVRKLNFIFIKQGTNRVRNDAHDYRRIAGVEAREPRAEANAIADLEV